jgi:hypothetical protein
MTMRFPYRRFTTRRPILTLGGRQDRPHPEISLSLVGPADTRVVRGLLDTGADDTVFPESVAADIGLNLTGAPRGGARGVYPGALPLRYAQVKLRVVGNGERREWTAWVGFTPQPLHRALLGFAGFLQFFTATFHGGREEVELAVNSLYPGT